jgi:hypothetical protein
MQDSVFNEKTELMTNQELRARTAILPEFVDRANKAGEELQAAQLRQGFVPNDIEALVHESITGAAPTFSDRPLTDLELATLDTWFVAHPDKIAGTQIAGSGYIAPVRTRGNMEDLERVFAFLDSSSETQVESSEPVLNSQTANLTVEQLRELEKAEYSATDPTDSAKRKEIYTKYDKLITPLLMEQKKGFSTSFKNELGARTDVFVLVPSDNATEFRVETKVHIPEGNEGIERIKIREKWFPIDQYDLFVADLKERVENASKPITHAEIYSIQTTIDKAKIKAKAKAKAKALVLALELERERE